MQRQFTPKAVLETIQKEGITCCMMVPTMINFILNEPDIDRYNLSSLQWIMVGGAPMSPANAQRMMQTTGLQVHIRIWTYGNQSSADCGQYQRYPCERTRRLRK